MNEPVKGLKRSIEESDPNAFMDGVARGTGSLARHTVGVSKMLGCCILNVKFTSDCLNLDCY